MQDKKKYIVVTLTITRYNALTKKLIEHDYWYTTIRVADIAEEVTDHVFNILHGMYVAKIRYVNFIEFEYKMFNISQEYYRNPNSKALVTNLKYTLDNGNVIHPIYIPELDHTISYYSW